MKTPGIALTAALGFFIFWGASPSPAQRYQPEKWEECADSELAAVFEKLTGQKAWKLQWQPVSMAKDPGQKPKVVNKAAWVLGPPKDAGDRISEGRVEYFFLGATDDHTKIWWPGDPSRWWSVQEIQTPNNYATRYVVAKRPSPIAKDAEDLARRIYDCPIFADPELPAKECLSLIDATYHLGMSALTSPELDQGIFFWDEDKKPSFSSLASITAKDTLKALPKDTPHPEECRIVFLSEGGDGGTLLVYRWKDGKAHLETTMGLSF